MIRTFRDGALKRFWNTGKAKGLPADELEDIKDILTALAAAAVPRDMDLPGLDFHELKGNRKGTYAVTIRARPNFRITWKWESGAAVQVDREDYHDKKK